MLDATRATILLADDEPRLRESLAELLETEG
jgi:CheY-like chemotaxis protein